MFGWGVQLLTGYVINSWLAKTLDPQLYGTYGVVMGILMWFEVGAISGIPTALQKFTAADETKAAAFLTAASRMQALFTLFLFVTGYLCAPVIAAALKDSGLTSYLKIAIWDIWIYSAFFILMSLQNGLYRFSRQAVMIGVFSVAKMVSVILFVTVMKSLDGAFYANIAGSVTGVLLGLYYLLRSGIHWKDTRTDWRLMLRFALPVAVFSLTINLFLNIDLWAVKYFLGGRAAGHYTAASILARVPYYIFFGLSATVLPGLARALAGNSFDQARYTIRTAVRLLFLTVLPLCVLSMTYGEEIIVFIFGQEYLPGGGSFRVLIWAFSLLAMFFLLTTIINADDRPRLTMAVTGGGIAVDLLLNAVLVPRYGINGAPLATLISLAAASCTAGWLVYRRFGPMMSGAAVARITAAAGLIYVLSTFVPARGAMTVPVMGGLYVLYGVLLVLFRELKKEDIIV